MLAMYFKPDCWSRHSAVIWHMCALHCWIGWVHCCLCTRRGREEFSAFRWVIVSILLTNTPLTAYVFVQRTSPHGARASSNIRFLFHCGSTDEVIPYPWGIAYGPTILASLTFHRSTAPSRRRRFAAWKHLRFHCNGVSAVVLRATDVGAWPMHLASFIVYRSNSKSRHAPLLLENSRCCSGNARSRRCALGTCGLFSFLFSMCLCL